MSVLEQLKDKMLIDNSLSLVNFREPETSEEQKRCQELLQMHDKQLIKTETLFYELGIRG